MVLIRSVAYKDAHNWNPRCSVFRRSDPEVIPEDAGDHYGRERYEWVVVEITINEGELDMEDVSFNSRIETEDRYHDLDYASGEIPEGVQSRRAVQEGGEAIAVYQIPEGAGVVGWDLSE